MFSPNVEQQLKSAGWSPERRVVISNVTSVLRDEGFSFSDTAEEILENLLGLLVQPIQGERNVFAPTPTLFDPVQAASGDVARVEFWEMRTGLLLSPIAECFGRAIVLATTDGKIFACWDDIFEILGETLSEALDVLVLAARPSKRLYGGRDTR